MPTFDLRTGDTLKLHSAMPSQSVHCVVTSPPYFGLRDYGVAEQVGLEATPEEYVLRLVEIFREVKRVLRDDGTLWLNLGDSYAGSWGNYGGQNRGNGQQREITNGSQCVQESYEGLEGWRPPTSNKLAGIKPKDLIGIPWMVAFALRADGWYLRQEIIWHKPNPMPESVTDRCTKSHEQIFLLAKSPRYYFDHESIKEKSIDPESLRPEGRGVRGKDAFTQSDSSGFARTRNGFSQLEGSRYPYRFKRSVWTITTVGYSQAHFATFPPKLIEPCILAGCPEGGTVLDPFAGAGTTGLVALRLNRNFIGHELNPEYVEMARRRIKSDAPMFFEEVA